VGAAVVDAVAGNVAGQLVGLAIGIQDEFNWSSVATAALTAGIIKNAYNERFNAGYKLATDTNYGQDKGGSYLKFRTPPAPQFRI
jgi:uncharacterized protein YbbC (DUF1343 family)